MFTLHLCNFRFVPAATPNLNYGDLTVVQSHMQSVCAWIPHLACAVVDVLARTAQAGLQRVRWLVSEAKEKQGLLK